MALELLFNTKKAVYQFDATFSQIWWPFFRRKKKRFVKAHDKREKKTFTFWLNGSLHLRKASSLSIPWKLFSSFAKIASKRQLAVIFTAHSLLMFSSMGVHIRISWRSKHFAMKLWLDVKFRCWCSKLDRKSTKKIQKRKFQMSS